MLALAAWILSRGLRRRSHVAASRRPSFRGVAGEDPAALEAAAAQAEQAGELERALRLRFRAGVLRLDERPSSTSGALSRRLRSRDFDVLARDLDEVVYGRRAAAVEDVARARETWPQVVAGARERS